MYHSNQPVACNHYTTKCEPSTSLIPDTNHLNSGFLTYCLIKQIVVSELESQTHTLLCKLYFRVIQSYEFVIQVFVQNHDFCQKTSFHDPNHFLYALANLCYSLLKHNLLSRIAIVLERDQRPINQRNPMLYLSDFIDSGVRNKVFAWK